MNLEKTLIERSESKCELCGSSEALAPFSVAPYADEIPEHNVYACSTCSSQISETEEIDINHWRCLNDSMWNPEPAVQVVVWRMLNRLKSEGWTQDLLDSLYLEDDALNWAKMGVQENGQSEIAAKHKDSNGVELFAGDTVVLLKDLNVKGTTFTAKRGTAVRNIALDPDNTNHIEGKVNSQQIVILTQFVKKS